jgi:GAF domain-containing protein
MSPSEDRDDRTAARALGRQRATDGRDENGETALALCSRFLRALPIDGAAISTLGAPFGTQTVAASDARSARIDELQFDLGEGPCWQALATKLPVLTDDLRTDRNPAWPMFRAALDSTDVGGLFAFPLTIGSLDIGVVDLYSVAPGALSTADIRTATELADVTARVVLRRALGANDPDGQNLLDPQGYSRRVVHQATGMILAQLELSAVDALLLLRGYAFSEDRTVRSVSMDIVERKLNFSTELAP